MWLVFSLQPLPRQPQQPSLAFPSLLVAVVQPPLGPVRGGTDPVPLAAWTAPGALGGEGP